MHSILTAIDEAACLDELREIHNFVSMQISSKKTFLDLINFLLVRKLNAEVPISIFKISEPSDILNENVQIKPVVWKPDFFAYSPLDNPDGDGDPAEIKNKGKDQKASDKETVVTEPDALSAVQPGQ